MQTTNAKKHVVALAWADLHFSHAKPKARGEDDWYAVMDGYLEQAHQIQSEFDGVPFITAGDVCHSWKEPAELLSFLIRRLPMPCYGIPGNHDAPFHSYEQLKRSAYWTLVEAGRIAHLEKGVTYSTGILNLHGFAFGHPVHPNPNPHDMAIEIAVVHDYLWTSPATCFEGAPEEKHIGPTIPNLRGYDTAIFGDNHIGFDYRPLTGKTNVYNAGTLMRRRADEVDYKPSIGLIYNDGSVERRYLDVSKDKLNPTVDDGEQEDQPNITLDLSELLAKGAQQTIEFVETVKQWMKANKTSDHVRQKLVEIIDNIR